MDYKSTLNLPKTPFPMKADLPKREPECFARWQAQDLEGLIRRAPHPKGAFILHDGPPYANGDIHIGHALNKILKDLIVRYKTMQGFDAPYVPGWDCHGMPIEHQLFKELKLTKHQIDQVEFRQKARAYAERYVGIQREQFKRLGVLGAWDHPYLTMSPDYELTILRVFRELVQAGFIYYGKKPVYWCATCETALAEAEVEYEDRTDTSIFVKFEITNDSKLKAMAGAASDYQGLDSAQPDTRRRFFFVIWTTTPWTLPANVAVALHPEHDYQFVPVGADEVWIVADPLVERVLKVNKVTTTSAKGPTKPGSLFTGVEYARPLTNARGVAVTDSGVSMAEGTGIVHIAPGHGHEDYLIGQRYKLEVLSPVDHQGRFTQDVPPFAGQTVMEANPKIIAELAQRGLLLTEEPVAHSYPHCWRCKNPVIFRATPQWFLSLEHQGLRQQALAAAKTVQWIPPAGLNRMAGMLETRPDWCVSRQRYWGTPIPLLHCQRCEKPITDSTIMQRVEDALKTRGVDAWFTASPQELVSGVRCPVCEGADLVKDTNILDVWFDSGVSHEAVLKARAGLRWPADLYLEGSDQHRGWFQVSLIPSVALHGLPPYRGVLTHGFVVDGEGRKMSKSLGNVVAPQEVMQRYGADILRLWVASCDYREDVRISEDILAQVAESYRKIRNTFRYLLANLYDFPPAEAPMPREAFTDLDRWALDRTRALWDTVTAGYERCQFHEVVRAMHHYCVVDLSAFYLDALKDRLYTEVRDGPARRCAQAVLYVILHNLVRMAAPILAVTAEEVWDVMRSAGWVSEPSVHLAPWPASPAGKADEAEQRRWAVWLSMREAVMKALEAHRAQGTIGSPLEARVTLRIHDPELRRLSEASRGALAEMFVVSDVAVASDGAAAFESSVPGLAGVDVERAPGQKCQRCWKHLTSVGSSAAHPHLCDRCARIVMMERP